MHPPISRATERSDRIRPTAGSAAAWILSCLPQCAAFLMAGMIASLLSSPLEAAELTVGRTDDPSPPLPCDGSFPCSLRGAILTANANPGSDSIVLPQGAYVLSIAGRDEDGNLQGDLDVTDALRITGAGAATTIIDAAGIDRVFDVHSGTLTLHFVRVTGGNALDVGGGPQTDGGGGLRQCLPDPVSSPTASSPETRLPGRGLCPARRCVAPAEGLGGSRPPAASSTRGLQIGSLL